MRNNNERYPEGYKPKIEYWRAKYYMALEEGIKSYKRGDRRGGEYWNEKASYANSKVIYFEGRENERVMSEKVSIW